LSNIDKNYTLYIQNGDSETNQASSALISLNGEKVVKTDRFNQKVQLITEKRYSYLEIGRELVLGAILGKWSTDDHDSVYYLSGLILSGFMVYGDIRDIAESIWRMDGLGGLLNAIGLIPALGDLTKNYIITCYIRYN
jgi:hypothetical protein